MTPLGAPPSPSPLVSLLIVNWNVGEMLRACLASVYEQAQMAPEDLEVVVVDNASTDGSPDRIAREFPQVKLIRSTENLGFGRGNNLGLAHCRGKYLLLLNPDTLVIDHAVDRLVEFMEDQPRVWAAGCRLLNGDGTLQRWTGGRFPTVWTAVCHYFFLSRLLPRSIRPPSLYLDRDVDHTIDVDWVSGACLILRRDKIGERIFDPAYFMYGEDMELCHRIKESGGQVVYTPVASIVHFQGASMKQQKGEILTTSLQGLRSFYRATKGRTFLWAIDTVTFVGFLVRYLAYGLADLVRPGRGYGEKKASSRHYMGLAARILVGG